MNLVYAMESSRLFSDAPMDARVARVRVRVGMLHRVVEDAFQQAFAHAAEGTEAENAAVDLVVLPVSATCLSVRSCRGRTKARISLSVREVWRYGSRSYRGEKNWFWNPSNTRQRATGERDVTYVFGNRRTNH